MKKNIAIIALAIVAALGLTTTGAVAGIGIAKGSIGSWHIQNDTIKAKDLKPNLRQKAKNGNKALKRIQRNRAAWAENDGLTGVESGEDYTHGRVGPEDGIVKVYAECPGEKIAISGGFAMEQPDAGAVPVVLQSAPSTREGDFTVVADSDAGNIVATAWEVIVRSEAGSFNANPWVVCASK